MQTHARIAIVGGGMMGCSLLYHLALEGCTDTVLIEKDELTSGSTWHAAGQCPSITGSYNLAKIHAYGNSLYPRLEALTGQYVSWHGCGGLRLANNEQELTWLKHVQGYSKSIGFPMELIGVEEIKRLNPFLTTEGVIAAAWTTQDGHADPSGLCHALAKGARDLGAQIVRHNRVVDIRTCQGGEWEVVTEHGTLIAEMVVNAAGCYAQQVAALVGARAPITNLQHHYLVTHPIPEFMARSGEIPVMRDSRTSGYFRQEQKSGLIGIYENAGLQQAWAPSGFPAWESSRELFADDLDRIAPWLERALERMPIFASAGIRRIINGAIPHTPDGAPLLGPAASLRNFWMCCGSSFGIAQGAGCGKFLAQWMLHGDAEINMVEFDPRRFGAFANDSYIRAKSFQDYRLTFTTLGPGAEEMAGRPQKISPLYETLRGRGAVHTETFGWERPKWFSLDGRIESPSYRRNNVFDVVGREVAGVHAGVGLLDLTGFAKFDIKGAGAQDFLSRISANKIPRKNGGIALVHMLSPAGRIFSEMTLTRLADGHFFALSAAAAELRDLDLMQQALRPGEAVELQNVTEDFGVLVLSGPRSRDVLQTLTAADLGNTAFPWLSAREISVSGHPLRALRVSYIGELGWELHTPWASMKAVYEALRSAGAAAGMIDYGLYAVNGMRLEKGYKAWGSELTNELTMLEADMARFIDRSHSDFTGRSATLERAPRPLKIIYAELDALDAAACGADARGGEPVLAGGACIGVVTSGGFGHRVGKSLLFACVDTSVLPQSGEFEVIVQGESCKARTLMQPAFDPSNSRLRG